MSTPPKGPELIMQLCSKNRVRAANCRFGALAAGVLAWGLQHGATVNWLWPLAALALAFGLMCEAERARHAASHLMDLWVEAKIENAKHR